MISGIDGQAVRAWFGGGPACARRSQPTTPEGHEFAGLGVGQLFSRFRRDCWMASPAFERGVTV